MVSTIVTTRTLPSIATSEQLRPSNRREEVRGNRVAI